MTTRRQSPFLTAAAAVVFAFTLAACGGGSGEAPPAGQGNVVNPAAPVVTITNNVTAETATGDITFTFSFNRDVGTTFTADDVTVTGGTKGAFTRNGGASATLVVTPTPDSAGSVELTVPAGAVTDAAGAGNAATTARKAYDTKVPPPPTGPVVLANFDDVTPPVAGYEGAEGSAIETGPAGGGSARSFKVLRSGGQPYALGIIETTVPFTATRRTVSAQVYSPTAAIPMVLKIEGPNGANTGDVAANEAVVVGWQTLTWTFAGADPALSFNKIVLLPNLGTVDAPPGKAYYFDTITLREPQVPPPAGTVLANFDDVTPPVAGYEGAEGSAIETGPAGGGSGRSFKVLRSGGQPYALGIIETTVPVTATRRTVSAQVYSPTAGIPMVLKIEGPNGANSGDVAANEAVVAGWQTLTWTFAGVDPALTFNKIVLLPNLGTVDAPPGKAYYFDSITLNDAPAPTGTILANFDDVSPQINGFEGATATIKAGPMGGSGNALSLLRSGGQVYALGLITLPGNVPLEAGRLTLSARVYSPTAGIPMVLKLEGTGGNPSSGDLQANEPVVAGWQTLTWTVPAVVPNYSVIVLLPNLGTVDQPPGKEYFFDDVQLLGSGGGGGGGGGGPLTFSSGFAAGGLTIQGGGFGGFGGSNLDGYNCSGDPVWCGGGGDTSPGVAAADSYYFYYYQTPSVPADVYMGIYLLAPGVTGLSDTADTAGIQINGQASMKFKLGQNAEWFGTATNKFAINLEMGKRYVVNGNTCRVQLRRIVTPTASAATDYTVALSSFFVVQDCAQPGLTVAAVLAGSPISQVSFQGVGGGIALTTPDGQSSGANRSVAVNGVYPTTLVVVGGISFE